MPPTLTSPRLISASSDDEIILIDTPPARQPHTSTPPFQAMRSHRSPEAKKTSSASPSTKAAHGIASTHPTPSDINSKAARKAPPTTVDDAGEGAARQPGGVRQMGSWKKSEVRALWEALDLLSSKMVWNDIAAKVPGRDKLSCQNKWRYDLLPKLQQFIDSQGE